MVVVLARDACAACSRRLRFRRLSDTDDISALATRHVTTQHGKSQAMLRYGSGKCAFSDDACAGNQCCQGVNKTGGKTYPCPSADRDWNECEMTDLALLQWNPMGCGWSPSALKDD
eukprot:CAMPEP_0180579486 /NCGR_PEP_ID=MMETSP1037_2-20121125/13017_1 /TAXON_ID=632150 /ORGANISM="Azadinium spinosum, Strain 3D9" /LENGTH=115 /DNA_ID=CAMNT_0022597351 /DNA_START=95 /DNA_END=442 /DNA_ORIENTATION=+